MGKAGRITCVLIPSLLTLAAFGCLLLIFLGQRSNEGLQQRIWLFSIDSTNFRLPEGVDENVRNDIKGLRDWYHIGLWNYCTGLRSDTSKALYCSPKTAYFWFNPLQALGLQNVNDSNFIEQAAWEKFQDGFKTASKWNFIALAIAFWTCAATFVVGFFAFFSRIGSFITWIVAGFATFFTVGGAITSTAIFLSLKGILKERLGDYNVTSDLGKTAFSLLWFAAAFIVAGSLFWMFSICCCGMGHSKKEPKPKSSRGRTPTWREPNSYQRVPSPYLGASGHSTVPLTQQKAPMFDQKAHGYESYRMDV